MATEIDVEKEKAKYQAEYDQLVSQLNALQQQLAQVTQAIAERRGILIFLNSLDQQKAK
jgi:prefoldin subunit 5